MEGFEFIKSEIVAANKMIIVIHAISNNLY